MNRCRECKECIAICKEDALSWRKKLVINKGKCNLCGKCAENCASEALEIIGREMSVKEIIREIEKDRIFYEESNGGVTFSGGEPLSQPDFLKVILRECTKRKIHTVVDTCGYAPQKIIEDIYSFVNLFLYDIKIMNDEKHRKYTGVSNKIILENLKYLVKKGASIEVRLPIIPGINDDTNNINEIADFLSSLGRIKIISILPYHGAGSEKYTRLNRRYRMRNVKNVEKEKIQEIKEILEEYKFKVKIGG
jgi:pyruvate formate lyase activating enzyme